MSNIDTFNNINEKAYIIVNNNHITNVSQLFMDMVDFTKDELLGENINFLFNSLRIGPYFNHDDIKDNADYFLFTKTLEVRFININIIKDTSNQIYIFKEKLNSRLEDKYNYAYHLLSENLVGGSIYSVPDFTLLKANQVYLDFIDAPFNSPDKTFGKQIYDFIKGYKGSNAEVSINDTIASMRSRHFRNMEYHGLARETTYWDQIITPIMEDGTVKYIVTTTQDVTEKVIDRMEIELETKQREEQNVLIKQQQQELNAIIEGMSEGLSIFDSNGKYTLFNKAAREMFFPSYGYMNQTGDGFYQAEYYYEESGNKIPLDELPANRVKNGKKFTNMRMKVKFPDKVLHISVSGTPIYDKNNNFVKGILCSRDISKVIDYEEKLKHQRDLLEMIVTNSRESLYVFKKDGSIILNKAMSEPTYKLDNIKQMIGVVNHSTINGILITAENSPIYKVLNGEPTINSIINFECNGNVYNHLVNCIPLLNKNGEFLYGLINSLDITEFINSNRLLNETQLKLLQAEHEKNQALQQAIEMKDEFLSLISHELRTPITVIDSAIQAMSLICWDELPDKSKKYIKTIKHNTYRQLRLVNNLLDIIRVNAGRIKVNKRNLDIVFLTRSIVENVYTYAAKSGVKLKFVSSINEKIMGIDEEKYERILLNLLSNAIKYTPQGKSIIVNLYVVKDNVCIQVKDSGIGIPEDKIDTIFERFGQVDSSLSRRAEGAGIGLSLVKKFVEAIGGTISVKSEVGKGSTFKVVLPEGIAKEDNYDNTDMSLLGNRHVDIIKVEFSDIYL